MNDESQQQETEHVRKKTPPAGDREETAATLAPLPLVIERIENTEPKTLFGIGSTLILRAPEHSAAFLYFLTHEQVGAACEEIADAYKADDQEEPAAAVDQEEPETAAEDDVPPPALNAAARICAQLNRIADALGADAIPFALDSDLDDVGRVEFRLMDIAGALERLDLAS